MVEAELAAIDSNQISQMNIGTTERCRCCDTISSYYETADGPTVYKVRYYCCPSCGFIQTEIGG